MPSSKRTGTPVPTDLDLEKTIRQLKKQQKKKKQSDNQGKSTEGCSEPIMSPKSLKSYGVSSPGGIPVGPTMPNIKATNMEIKPALINMIQRTNLEGIPLKTLQTIYNDLSNSKILSSTKGSLLIN